MIGQNIAGPIFVSIGDEEKLGVFLEKNPQVDPSQAFVDDYAFGAYAAAGFGRFDEVDKETANAAMKNMGAPMLGWKGTWDYLTSAAKVSPIPKGEKPDGIPEGVLRLGGTFVVSGNEIVYRWSDRLPGDHPDIDAVLTTAQEANKNLPKNPLASLFGL